MREILDTVKEKRDQALFEYTEKFDGAQINADNILVTEAEIKEAYDNVDPNWSESYVKHLKYRVLPCKTDAVQLV